MGTTGSVASGKDENIEMNIADEAPMLENQRSMKRHNSQPQAVSLFNQLKLRPKQHADGNMRQSSSLRSSASFDPNFPTAQINPVTNAGNNQAESTHQIRHDYELQKVTMDQEIQNLRRKEQKLETENNRLRAELQALNKQCQRLRTERDAALSSSHEATERAIALEQDREKIQRQFKIFRETKEGEIQSLLQAKRQLESNFHRMEAQGMAMIDDHNFTAPDNNNLLNLHSAYGEWWAAPESEITSLFDSCTQIRSRYHQLDQQKSSKQLMDVTSLSSEAWMTSSNNLSNFLPISNVFEEHGRNVLRVYISTTPDCVNDVTALLRHHLLKKLEILCNYEGYFLNIVHFSGSSDYEKFEPKSCEEGAKKMLKIEKDIRFAISTCDLFVSFIGTNLGSFTEVEFDEGFVKRDGKRSTFFCLRSNQTPPTSQNSPTTQQTNNNNINNKLLRHKITKQSSKQNMFYNSTEDACKFVLIQIVKAVRLIFGIKTSLQIDDKSNVMSLKIEGSETISCIDEIPIDEILEQQQENISIRSISPSNQQPVGFDKCYDRLDEVVTSPGPVPPLLVSGSNGSGKTLLLSSWAHKLRSRRPDVIVLQHHVTGCNSLDAEPVIIFRRLLSQLIRHLPVGTLPPLRSYATYDVIRLKETLPRWLEQLSARLDNRVVLVIDSLDLVKDAPIHFQWLLDPLHVGVRVIISVSVDNCAEIWRNWPTLHLEPFSVNSVRQLIQKSHSDVDIPLQMRNEVISQCRTSTTYHPLYVALLCAVARSVCTNESDESVWLAALRTRDVVELYRLILREIESASENRQHRNQLKLILQFIVCSRDGLAETELLTFVQTQWSKLYAHLRKLLLLMVLKEEAGFYRPHNSEIATILYDLFVTNKTHQRKFLNIMATEMRSYYDKYQATPRTMHVLPWLLHQLDERDSLYDVIYSPQLLHLMYTRGRINEVVSVLNYLNEEKLSTSKLYHDNIRKLETTNTSSDDVMMMQIANMYASLGRFDAELGLMEEAVSSLQKSLEIREIILDPDHPSVADSLHYLASVYAQWNKFNTAESLFRHALELVEGTVGRDHLRVAQELASLIRIIRKSGKVDIVESLQIRMMRVYQKNGTLTATGLERLRKRTLTLEELTVEEDSLEIAKALNDLAVMNHMQKNFDNAESFFLRSLNMRRKLLGENHLEVAQSFYNLALVNAEQKKLKSAIESMQKALDIRQRANSGCNDDVIISTMKGLALLHKKSKDRNGASRLYAKIVDYQKQLLGERNPIYANALLNQAVCESQNGNLDTALPLYEKALEIYRSCHGDDSQQASHTLRNIAVLLYQKGDHEKAALAYKKSVKNEQIAACGKSPW